jgi:hypothetical protein
MDITRFISLWESIEMGDCVATPDTERDGLYRHIYICADGDKAIYRDMLDMLGDVSHIIDVEGKKTVYAKVKDRLIAVRQDADEGFMLYMDAHNNLLGEVVTLSDVIRLFGSEK